jgi:hypothetical protein
MQTQVTNYESNRRIADLGTLATAFAGRGRRICRSYLRTKEPKAVANITMTVSVGEDDEGFANEFSYRHAVRC